MNITAARKQKFANTTNADKVNPQSSTVPTAAGIRAAATIAFWPRDHPPAAERSGRLFNSSTVERCTRCSRKQSMTERSMSSGVVV